MIVKLIILSAITLLLIIHQLLCNCKLSSYKLPMIQKSQSTAELPFWWCSYIHYKLVMISNYLNLNYKHPRMIKSSPPSCVLKLVLKVLAVDNIHIYSLHGLWANMYNLPCESFTMKNIDKKKSHGSLILLYLLPHNASSVAVAWSWYSPYS